MAAIKDLGERNRLAATIPGSHLRVSFKVSPLVLEMLLRGSSNVLRGSPATLRGWGSPVVRSAGLARASARLARARAWIRELHPDSAEAHRPFAHLTSLRLPTHPPMDHCEGLADVLRR
eukprot:4872544-Pleurochrysis_carterae.AAC.1